MRVLVTGASGYIGQHLCLNLKEQGWEVRGISRSSQPVHLQDIEWVQGSVTDFVAVSRAIPGCQVVVHLASLSLSDCKLDPVNALKVNIVGTRNLLEAAKQFKVDKFIFASSGQVYGGKAQLPNRESDQLNPESVYAVTKVCAENWCSYYDGHNNLPVIQLRLFNVYGHAVGFDPRPTVETVFLRKLLNKESPVIQGNLNNGRDYIYIDDVVRAISLSLTAVPFSSVINVGTGVLTTMYELAIISARLSGNADIEPHVATTQDLFQRFQADVRTAKEALQFKASVELELGLTKLLSSIQIGQT